MKLPMRHDDDREVQVTCRYFGRARNKPPHARGNQEHPSSIHHGLPVREWRVGNLRSLGIAFDTQQGARRRSIKMTFREIRSG